MSTALPLHDLEIRHPGITKALGETYCEAAAVCLDRHHNAPAIDTALAENHALAIARDKLEPEPLARFISQLRAIQSNPDRLRRYCRAAAGYGDIGS